MEPWGWGWDGGHRHSGNRILTSSNVRRSQTVGKGLAQGWQLSPFLARRPRESTPMPQPHFESLTLEVDGGERVPAISLRPRADTAVPGVLLLHGFSSRKEQMVSSLGHALLAHGVASLAIDLPLHGARDGDVEGIRGTPSTIADPNRAARNFAGRPLLMINGRHDRTIRPEQAHVAGQPPRRMSIGSARDARRAGT